jgi:hypothetical protein
MLKMLIQLITKKEPKYHEKRTLGSHTQLGGLLKTLDQAIKSKKSAPAIIKILGRAANLRNEKGYETAVSELLFQGQDHQKKRSNLPTVEEGEDWYNPNDTLLPNSLEETLALTNTLAATTPSQPPLAPSSASNKKQKTSEDDTFGQPTRAPSTQPIQKFFTSGPAATLENKTGELDCKSEETEDDSSAVRETPLPSNHPPEDKDNGGNDIARRTEENATPTEAGSTETDDVEMDDQIAADGGDGGTMAGASR